MNPYDLNNVVLTAGGPCSAPVYLARRLLRRLLRPYFTRSGEIALEVADRATRAELRADAAERQGAAVRGVQDHLDALNHKLESLNRKLDALNEKFDALNEKAEAVRLRQDRVDETAAAIVALNWDHTAIARRLAALEDRGTGMDGQGETSGHPRPGNESEPTLRFPGLDAIDTGDPRPSDRPVTPSDPTPTTHARAV